MRFVGIDPSTKTGFVILDKNGEIIDTMEITAKGDGPARMLQLVEDVAEQLKTGDIVAIEGFSYGSKGKGVDFQYGLGWSLRLGLYSGDFQYYEVAPAALKKFCGAKGNSKKDELAVHIYKQWGFEHKSDNVRDAYVLAQIARSLSPDIEIKLTKQQLEVLQVIKNPKTKKKRGKEDSA